MSFFTQEADAVLPRCNFLRFTRTKAITGLILGIAAFYVCRHFYFSNRVGMFFAIAFFLTGLFRLETKESTSHSHVWGMATFLFSLLLVFVVCFFSLDFVRTDVTAGLAADKIFLNFLCAASLFFIALTITGNCIAALCTSVSVMMILSTVNYFVYDFRGKEFTATDIFAAATAANVASQYSFQLTAPSAFRWIGAILVCFSAFSLPSLKKAGMKIRIAGFVAFCASFALLSVCTKDLNTVLWNFDGSYKNGYYLNFYLGLESSFVKEPENYSPEKLENISNVYSPQKQSSADLPNIIVIMSEAYSDLDVLDPAFNSMSTYSPFISSLCENTIKGHALVSVYAGGTANSEFEFLTGHSMAFFPQAASVVPYQQYIKDSLYCLPMFMESLGYSSFATHPFLANGWSREKIYPLFGFDDISYIESYPQADTIRGLISDSEMYGYILSVLDSCEGEAPLFLFGVSIQNHGGYQNVGNYDHDVVLEGMEGIYPETEMYLSLINKTDDATKDFLLKLKDYPEDTLVVFFGDHMPMIEDDIYSHLNGGELNTLDEQMLKYTVPFFIWANYDIEEYTIEQTSLNYLAGHMLDAAGIQLPPYYQFLRDTENVIPAINAFGYYSKSQGRMLPLAEAQGEEADAIRNYRYVQHNNMFDADNRSYLFFGQYLHE